MRGRQGLQIHGHQPRPPPLQTGINAKILKISPEWQRLLIDEIPRKSMLKSQVQFSQYDQWETQRPEEFKACRLFQIYQLALGIAWQIDP